MPRRVSSKERALWHAYVSLNAVQALPGRDAPPPAAPAAEALPAVAAPAAPPSKPTPGPLPPVAVGQPAPGLDTRRWRDLRRGRTRPERTLDLHGRRAGDAHAATLSFIRDAHADGVRCVAIVTGKGGGEGGVLRRELPHWLNLPGIRPLVLGAAHEAANTGAVHLLLRRRRAAR